MAGKQPVLCARQVTKSFYETRALGGVDFDLMAGEVHAVIGENGAGKSTLAKILAGVFPPDGGQLLVDSGAVSLTSPADALRYGIATIYQDRMLVRALTVADNIALGHEPGSVFIDGRALRRRARESLMRLGLDVDPGDRIRSLGPHQQQMVMIAKALTLDARVLILDEPTSALTEHETERLFEVIRQLRDEGMAVMYITHRLEELPLIADRVTVFKDGERVGTRQIAEVTKDDCIQMMVGRRLETLFPEIDWEPGEELVSCRALQRRPVLKDVSLAARRGEILGLFGLVGSGTSATVRAMYGADRLAGGTLALGGEQVRRITPGSMSRRGVAFVPGDRKTEGLVLDFSVRANITLGSLEGFTRFGMIDPLKETRVARRQAEHLTVRCHALGSRVRFLSGGNQQKVVLAKSLCRDIRLLLIDEPTWGIDLVAKAEIYQLLADLARQGMTIVVASSDLAELMGMCHRILVMREGRVSGEYERGGFVEESVLRAAFAQVNDHGGHLQ